MTAIRVQEAASHRIDEIFRFTRERWGVAQAENYITGLFESFARIETHEVLSRPIPAGFGVEGFFFRDEKHFVYWKRMENRDIGIVTILHERMHQLVRLKDDFIF